MNSEISKWMEERVGQYWDDTEGLAKAAAEHFDENHDENKEELFHLAWMAISEIY